MTLDPILAEVRRVREAYAQQFNGDVRLMMNDFLRHGSELYATCDIDATVFCPSYTSKVSVAQRGKSTSVARRAKFRKLKLEEVLYRATDHS